MGMLKPSNTGHVGQASGRVGRQRRDVFKVKYNGKEGWLSIDDLVPLYLFSDDKVREEQARFDPIENQHLEPNWAREEYGSDKTTFL